MPAHTMLFLRCIISLIRYSEPYGVTSKYSDVISSNKLRSEAKEDSSKQQKIDITQFLLNECGFSESQVLAIGRRKSLFKAKSIHRARQAVQLFRDSGFTEDQVRKIILLQANSLELKVNTRLKPKIEFMKALGFSGSKLGHIITRVPRLLSSNLEKNLRPKVPLLIGAFGSKLNLCKILMRQPRILTCNIDNLEPKIDILKQSCMQDELVLFAISTSPCLILCSEEALKLKIGYVRSLGFLEGSKAFVRALATVDDCGLEHFENKLKHMATFGLLENEIVQIVRKAPRILTCSIDKINKNMDFLKNIAGFQPNIVVSYPRLLAYSIEKRLQPRNKVIEFLRETELSRLPICLARVYDLSEQNFANKFLMGSPEATKLFEKYKGKSIDLAIT